MSSQPFLSLHVTVTVAPENAERFLEALKPAYDAVIAEPECVFFEVFRSPEEPGIFKFVENWNATKEWLITVSSTVSIRSVYILEST
jgi:quinol monooxygenase YgiN